MHWLGIKVLIEDVKLPDPLIRYIDTKEKEFLK